MLNIHTTLCLKIGNELTKKSYTKMAPMIMELWRHLSPRRKKQFFGVLFLLHMGALAEILTIGTLIPFLIFVTNIENIEKYPALNTAITTLGWNNNDNILLLFTIFFGISALLASILRILLVWAVQKYTYGIGYDLSVKVYRLTLSQPYSYHVLKNSSELIAANQKIQSLIGTIINPSLNILMNVTISIFILSTVFLINPELSIIIILFFSIIYFSISIFTKNTLIKNSKIISNIQNERIKMLQEGYGGIKDIILSHAQPVYVDSYARIDANLKNTQIINSFIGTAPSYAVQALGMTFLAGLTYILAGHSGGLISALPTLGALTLGAQRLMPMAQLVYQSFTKIRGHHHVFLDVLDLLKLKENQHPSPPLTPALTFNNELIASNVTFGYDEDSAPTLDKINLRIKKGAKIGLVGETGSGKSTLIDILMGLLEPTSGHVFVDGHTLTKENLRQWQKRIAHVPQSMYLLDASFAENIAFGIPANKIDMKKVRRAAQRATISNHIESLPNGYQTLIGERGIKISGGQRQRLGIARALYNNAEVLILDEATSALDNKTEKNVMTALDDLDKDMTIIMIAHRLSTVQNCDKIVRIESGHIVAEGHFDDVISSAELQ